MEVSEYIAHQAYRIWINRGAYHGNDLDDWYKAEKLFPEKIMLGWKSIKYDSTLMTPGLINWKELFIKKKYQYQNTEIKSFISEAWLDKHLACHYNGVQDFYSCPLVRCPELLFPTEQQLKERNLVIKFYGPIYIIWKVETAYGRTQSLNFIFIKHHDTIVEELSRTPGFCFKCNFGEIHEFPKNELWNNLPYAIKN